MRQLPFGFEKSSGCSESEVWRPEKKTQEGKTAQGAIKMEDTMDREELTKLLVESAEDNSSQDKFIPWWEDDFEEAIYRYEILEEDVIQGAEACVPEAGKEALLTPVGKAGVTLFHLLVWHNFYHLVEQLLLDKVIGPDEINTTDGKGHGLTALMVACARGNFAMAKLLLEHGAEDSLCDERGMNGYHFLVYPRFQEGTLTFDNTCIEKGVEQRGEIARLLTCDINQPNCEGLKPLEKLLSTSYCADYTWPLTEVFLEKGAATDYVDEDGNTLLMMARRNGHKTAALALMRHCPELVNVANHNGVTPIAHAVEYRNMAMYLALKDFGANPVPEMELFPLSQITNSQYFDVRENDKDALSIAIYMTRKLIDQVDPDDDDEFGEVLDILHSALNSDRNATVLEVCKEEGMEFTMPIHYKGKILCLRDECLHASYGMGVLKKLVELGVDMEKAVVRGRTPANILADNSGEDEAYYEEATRMFSKDSMEQTDNRGKAAIHGAVEHGHMSMLRVMIEKGVDVNLTMDEPGEAGMTALHIACMEGNVEAVELLMASGADDTMKTLQGNTPAHLVLTEKRYGENITNEQKAEMLKLLKHLDLPNEEGQTPFMLVHYWTRELLPVFLERGVDVNHTDNEGRTALMLHTTKEMAKELLLAGADINLADNEGNTALHYALYNSDDGGSRFLVKKGADYNRANNDGETPVQLAVEKGMETVLELMTDIK